jgi:hypothetical protein
MNQPDNNVEQNQTESLVDLEVTSQQAEDAKAGTGTHATGAGGGKVHVADLSL